MRSAATTLTRFRLAVLACSEALEAGAEASRLLAHQVPYARDQMLHQVQIPKILAHCIVSVTVVIMFIIMGEGFPDIKCSLLVNPM